jgi:hypothetical protein
MTALSQLDTWQLATMPGLLVARVIWLLPRVWRAIRRIVLRIPGRLGHSTTEHHQCSTGS